MKAIILAAGQGKRLRPLTDNIPKCMVEFQGKSLLAWQIDTMKKCGIKDIVVVTGYKSEAINFPKIKYYKNENFETTNMVETLFCAEDEITESVIVSYGDIIYQKDVLSSLIKDPNDISIVVDKQWRRYWETRFDDLLSDAESLKIEQNGNISSIGQKVDHIEEIEGQYIGLMKFQKGGSDYIKNFYHKTKKSAQDGDNPLNSSIPFIESYMTDFLQGAINDGAVLRPVYIKNGWLEIDSVKDFETYNEMYKNKSLEQLILMEQVG